MAKRGDWRTRPNSSDHDRAWLANVKEPDPPITTLEEAGVALGDLAKIKAHREWVIAGLREHVANVEADLERARDRIERLEAHQLNVEADNDDLSAQKQKLELHVTNVEAECAVRDRRVAELECHVDNIDNWVSSWRGQAAQHSNSEAVRAGNPVDWQTEECRRLFDGSGYYAEAEDDMTEQWEKFIEPRIKNVDFETVLELAPGHGRNTEHLIPRAKAIYLVDVNKSCIKRCRKRFKKYSGPCQLLYYVNDGHSLSDIDSGIISFVYSWDSMVHFDKMVVRDYVLEFARVMKPGATGFVHHSNYGHGSQSSEWIRNPAWRSNMTLELFADYCAESGLEIIDQQTIDWILKDLDCISTFRKPG